MEVIEPEIILEPEKTILLSDTFILLSFFYLIGITISSFLFTVKLVKTWKKYIREQTKKRDKLS
jgi:hypothetical protein